MIFQLTVFAMGLIADTGGVCFRILAQIVFQYTRIIRGCSVNHGQIFFFQSVCAHRVGQPGSRLGGFGINHHPAHRPIKPVHQSGIHISRFLICHADILPAHVQKALILGGVGSARHIDGLFHAKDMIVLIEHIDHKRSQRP